MRMTGIKFRGAVAWGLGAALCAAPAAAQAPALRFDARLVPATAVLAATTAIGLAPVVFASHLPHATCAPCDPAGLPGVDRGTVGLVRTGAATVSDATLFATAGGAGLLLLREAHGDLRIAREDLTVLAQAVATASLLTNWAKVLFHRPRPYRYVPAAAGSGGAAESGLSFPSGHTSASFAAAFAYWSIQARRGRAHARVPRIAALVATAAATGVLRVAAREHFPTDVAAGALLGAAVGWAVPRLYPVQRHPSPW
jgi:membrane-associated phospholipid phosphatase